MTPLALRGLICIVVQASTGSPGAIEPPPPPQRLTALPQNSTAPNACDVERHINQRAMVIAAAPDRLPHDRCC